MLAYLLYTFLAGYALFLLGFAIFMYFENQKFGDNQFTMKLLPPPPRLAAMPEASASDAEARRAGEAVADWTPVRVTVSARSEAGSAAPFAKAA